MTKPDKKALVAQINIGINELDLLIKRVPDRVMQAPDVRAAQNWKHAAHKALHILKGNGPSEHERPGKLQEKLGHIEYLIGELA
jgi:hypothetical protein